MKTSFITFGKLDNTNIGSILEPEKNFFSMEAKIFLKRERQRRGLSQIEAAADLGVSQSYYSAVERGKKSASPKLIESVESKWGIPRGSFIEPYSGDKLEDFFTAAMIHSNNKVVDKMISDLKKDPLYGFSKNLGFSLVASHSSVLKDFIASLNRFWETIMRLMQFIHQYDSYLVNNIGLQIYRKGHNGQMSQEELLTHVNTLFDALKDITPIVNEMQNEMQTSMLKLKRYDFEETLEKSDWQLARQYLADRDFSSLVMLEPIFNILEKQYPVI